MRKSQSVAGVVLPLAVLVALILLMMPGSAKLGYDYKKGAAWQYETLVAPFDFPILKTEEQILEERLALRGDVIPYFRFDGEALSSSILSLEKADMGSYSYLRPAVINVSRQVLDKGILSEEGASQVSAQDGQGLVYIQKDKHASKYPADEVYTLSRARNRIETELSLSYPEVNVDSLLRDSRMLDMILPDLVFDRQTTMLVHSSEENSVSPTAGYVSAGQLIVSSGEIVTAEIAQVIDSYCREYESSMGYNTTGVLFFLGNFIIALAVVVLLFFAIKYNNSLIFDDRHRYLYVLTISLIFMSAGLLVPRYNPSLVYLIPFTLCALYLEAFFANRLIFAVYAVTLLPLLLFAPSGIVAFTTFLVGGVVSIYSFKLFNKGWRQFINAFLTFAAMAVVYTGFYLADVVSGDLLRVIINLFAASVFAVAGYPLTYLFEKIFNLVSFYRLSELCDTSLPLLHQLEQKAPGTFQHSLQVMNMADAAARAIGANQPLVRAGALYHDIGKMQNPLCFVENESMLIPEGSTRYHSSLTPVQSAQDIIRHVSDGEELARKYHLPEIVVDFIRTHHGTALVSYFHDIYIKEGGSPENEDEFRYDGTKPESREQIILMLCDSIEAASRTLKDFSQASFSSFVENIVSQKMAQGQFDEAEISVRELRIVKEVLKSYLAQMYHERIAYPKRNKKQ